MSGEVAEGEGFLDRTGDCAEGGRPRASETTQAQAPAHASAYGVVDSDVNDVDNGDGQRYAAVP